MQGLGPLSVALDVANFVITETDLWNAYKEGKIGVVDFVAATTINTLVGGVGWLLGMAPSLAEVGFAMDLAAYGAISGILNP